MVHTDIVDISDDSKNFYMSWVLCQVSNYGIKIFVNVWNHHTIASMFLLICSKILIKRNPTGLYLLETRLFALRVCSKYVIDNRVIDFTWKTHFSKFNPGGTERYFDINPTLITYK